MSWKPDVVAILVWTEKTDELQLYSNIRDEALDEVLTTWLSDRVQRCKPAEGALVERPVYTVKIGLRIEDDSFGTEHNCGAEGLMVGLVMEAIKRLPLENKSLRQWETDDTLRRWTTGELPIGEASAALVKAGWPRDAVEAWLTWDQAEQRR